MNCVTGSRQPSSPTPRLSLLITRKLFPSVRAVAVMLLGAFSSVRASLWLIATCLPALSMRTLSSPRLTLTSSRNTSVIPGMWATPTSTPAKASLSPSSLSTTRLVPCARKMVTRSAILTIATLGPRHLPTTASAWRLVRSPAFWLLTCVATNSLSLLSTVCALTLALPFLSCRAPLAA